MKHLEREPIPEDINILFNLFKNDYLLLEPSMLKSS